jgi:hypothetical protein
VVAENVAVVADADTGTEAGTVRAPLLLERITFAPPAGAARFNVTVQVVDAFGPRLEGAQESPATAMGPVRLRLMFALAPPKAAVMVAV